MDKQKQIEEMARTFGGCHITPNCKVCCAYSGSTDCPNKTNAQKLYNAGYRKIPEGAVVLTREEHQKYLAYKIIEPQIRGCLDRERELEKRLQEIAGEFAKEYLAVSEQTRKETAEKFAEKARAKSHQAYVNIDEMPRKDGFVFLSDIDEICKEITESEE